MLKRGPIRVLQVIHRMRPGGIQAIIMDVYRNIDRKKVQFDFAVRSKSEEHYDREIESLGGRIFRLPWWSWNPLSLLSYQNSLNETLRKHGPFIAVHSHVGFYSGLIIPMAKASGIPIRIAHSHNTSSAEYNIVIKWIWESLMRSQILRNANHLIACNERAFDWLFGADCKEKQHKEIIHNAINLSAFSPDKIDDTSLHEELSIPERARIIVHIGRFDTQKNHRFLIKLMSELINQDPDFHLVLVGEGDLFQDTKRLVKEKGLTDQIHFLGVRRDVPRILRSADIFLLPSLYEGLPVVLIEAQAAGVPCLVSDVISDEADVNLGLIEYESLSASFNNWIQAIYRSLAKQRIPWDERKKALKQKGFDVQSMVDRLMNIYCGNNLDLT